MSDQDPATESEQLLAAINEANATPPEPEPEPLPPPEPMSAVEFPPEVAPAPPAEETVLPRPASSGGLPAPSAWMRHRHEIAGLVTAFVAIVWVAVGIAMGAWAPALLGALFAGGAAVIRAYAPSI